MTLARRFFHVIKSLLVPFDRLLSGIDIGPELMYGLAKTAPVRHFCFKLIERNTKIMGDMHRRDKLPQVVKASRGILNVHTSR